MSIEVGSTESSAGLRIVNLSEQLKVQGSPLRAENHSVHQAVRGLAL